ncbi:uncharacterized protein YndB with AHSA1/START domain [Peribacillus deserti]|uniref:Uncharacterized protein YndB with AHSA1/START domain n=1 Tax=Peribacillus deserti TaxID=673318 RepID=A0ABS2QII6_9BACI|nr:SRPBCC family protein [Peribacillus deserti]MBM7692785.1 uncharacterized protein YndB with AHSA1/START domain [Peribacillus deserti]
MSTQSFVYVTYIAATPEHVWQGITDGEFTKKYFFGRKVESHWQEGSAVRYLLEDGALDVSGKVLKIDPERLLSFTWEGEGDETPREFPTVVTFELKPMEGSVKLTLRHDHLQPGDFVQADDTFAGLNNGWPAIISNLKSLLETGKTLPAVTV